MKIYSISGFCPDNEDGEAHIVHEVHISRENAEAALKELIECVREQAILIEDAKGIGSCKGIWTETLEETHGSTFSIKSYSCSVSIDLANEEGLALFRKLSPIGLIDGNGSIDLKDGISVTHLYSAMSFRIASLHLSAKEL